jgi:DNA (cytosine-5)-methyltransferase 1
MSQAKNEVDKLCKFHDYDFRKYKGSQVLNKIARNLVDYEAGKTILETALGIITKSNIKQTELF